ncbi:Guanylate kinase [Candidatus Providencia siddallii]|uniref:Guanylate kinase n=1 Tax=Candidatus Providencia siddallii TaxID=1715285 RepID=A0A0M6W8Z5_9GAMM|nr:Guanylate kinase [Candidatus Providencia siddallii]
MTQGVLYVISAPSGAGKSSLINSLLKTKLYNTQISISYTTRTARPGEINGKDYFFISKIKFLQMIKNHDFLEYAYVFGNYYGTSKIFIENTIKNYIDIILNIDWQGAKQIKTKIHETKSIFILPPSKNELYRRLYNRGQDNNEVIKNRMLYAISEIKHFNEYDYIIINDNFKTALKDLKSIINCDRLKLKRQTQKTKDLITKLLAD